MIKFVKQMLIVFCIGCFLVGCSDTTQSINNAASEASQQLETAIDDVEMNSYGNANTYDVDESDIVDEQMVESEQVTKTATSDEELEKQTVAYGSTLEVHYIDVEQGDSILIKQGMHSMLIDAGNNDKGTTVWSYLLGQDVDTLDYAICTHPDADHIGGMDVVLYKIDCDSVLMPVCEHETETYKDLIRTIGQREQKVTVPKRGEAYSLGEAQFQILTDTEINYGDNNNDYSIAIRLTFGETSFLFTGDAEEKAEQDMMNSGLTLASDVYKAAHHGANWSNTESFLTAVNPTYAVISCGEGNSYGHPRAEVLNHLRSMGVKVFRTDEQGSIIATSDGINITFNCSPSTTWKAGEPIGSGVNALMKDGEDEIGNVDGSEEQREDSAARQSTTDTWKYILNTRSMKIHYPHCSSVDNMAEKNKGYSNLSKEELMAQGYEPCGNCRP